MNFDEIDTFTYIKQEIEAAGYNREIAKSYSTYALWRKNRTHTLQTLDDYEQNLIKQYSHLTYVQHLILREIALDAMGEYVLRA